MNAVPKELHAPFAQAAEEAKPLADVIVPGAADFRSQEATLLGMRYEFGPAALAYTDRALKAFCGDQDADGLIERNPDGVTIVLKWE